METRLLIVVLPAALLIGCDALAPVPAIRQVPSPALVPGVSAVMNTPGYWIGLHPDPDRLVMTAAEIAAFNRQIREDDLGVAGIVDFNDTVDGEKLKADLIAGLGLIRGSGYSRADGRQPDDGWWQSIEDNLNLAAVGPEITVRFGLIVGFCDHRVLPTTEGLYGSDLNLNFDRLQDSTLDIAAPVAVLHRSRDEQWLYVVGETMRGWVSSERVALCEREIVERYVRAEEFAVVTAAKADLYADENLRNHVGRVQMGTRLAAAQDDGPNAFRVFVPSRDQDGACTLETAYIQRIEASLGHLPYTPRTIINQAFKLLHTPYGWGGLFGEQDCSRFVQEVFATVGLILPRNSSEQARIGREIYANPQIGLVEDKLAALDGHAAALALLRLNGHIMLFLGSVNGRPYVIHDLWSYDIDESTVAVVNRVAVTPADLGSGPAGTLLDRVNTIRVLDRSSEQR
ncbi:MAG: SH3 domain-containing protein [Phycisphaerales bacterium]